MPDRSPSPDIHLLRGAPPVRPWSKYQRTVPEWTLCGIRRFLKRRKIPNAPHVTEIASEATCRFCKILTGFPAKKRTRVALRSQEHAATAG